MWPKRTLTFRNQTIFITVGEVQQSSTKFDNLVDYRGHVEGPPCEKLSQGNS